MTTVAHGEGNKQARGGNGWGSDDRDRRTEEEVVGREEEGAAADNCRWEKAARLAS